MGSTASSQSLSTALLLYRWMWFWMITYTPYHMIYIQIQLATMSKAIDSLSFDVNTRNLFRNFLSLGSLLHSKIGNLKKNRSATYKDHEVLGFQVLKFHLKAGRGLPCNRRAALVRQSQAEKVSRLTLCTRLL